MINHYAIRFDGRDIRNMRIRGREFKVSENLSYRFRRGDDIVISYWKGPFPFQVTLLTINRDYQASIISGDVDQSEKYEIETQEANRTSEIRSKALELLEGYRDVYIYPDISDRKLRGSNSKFGPLADEGDQLIALIDESVFRGGDLGVAIYEDYIVYTGKKKKAEKIVYSELLHLTVEETFPYSIKLGNQTIFFMAGEGFDEGLATQLAKFLRWAYKTS